jgi:cellulose synthase/poly-beta-1,6-N-acetylglucosamine synthase-like glycosyltransferase
VQRLPASAAILAFLMSPPTFKTMALTVHAMTVTIPLVLKSLSFSVVTGISCKFCATVKFPFSTIPPVVQPSLGPVTPVVPASLGPVPPTIHMLVYAIPLALKSLRFSVVAGISRMFRTTVKPVLNAIAFVVQTLINAIPLAIQAFINTVTFCIQPLINPVASVIKTIANGVICLNRYRRIRGDQETDRNHNILHDGILLVNQISANVV